MTKKIDIEEIKQKMFKKLEPSGWSRILKSFIFSSDFENIVNQLVKFSKDNKRFTWRDIPGKRLWKLGKPDPKVTSRVDEIINKMDDWRLSHSDLDRPMTGFVKNYGRKPTFWLDELLD